MNSFHDSYFVFSSIGLLVWLLTHHWVTSYIFIIKYLFYIYILLVCERFLAHNHGRGIWRRNRSVKNDVVDIAGNVDYHIDVDSDSSSKMKY